MGFSDDCIFVCAILISINIFCLIFFINLVLYKLYKFKVNHFTYFVHSIHIRSCFCLAKASTTAGLNNFFLMKWTMGALFSTNRRHRRDKHKVVWTGFYDIIYNESKKEKIKVKYNVISIWCLDRRFFFLIHFYSQLTCFFRKKKPYKQGTLKQINYIVTYTIGIHSNVAWPRSLGKLLLACHCFTYFILEHKDNLWNSYWLPLGAWLFRGNSLWRR